VILAQALRALPFALALLGTHSPAALALQDPTAPPAALRADPGQPPSTGSRSLQAILSSRERATAAVIDGQTVPLGGWVGQAKLIRIGADHVVLKGSDGTQTLRLMTHIRKTRPTQATGQDTP
jgi:MSHA biogenesis protein MshK